MPEEVRIDYRTLWLSGAAFIVLLCSVVLLVVNVVQVSRQAHDAAHQARDAAETHTAVCVYRANLLNEAVQAQKYLAAHPNGIPSLHISEGQLAQTIFRERAAVDALSGLHCD